MKTLLFSLFLLIHVTCFAQRFQEVVLWQVETRAEGLVFGISESIKDASFIIKDFQKRNANSKYDVSAFNPVFKYTTFPVESRNEDPVEKFRQRSGKMYKVLSKEDVKSLEIAKTEGIHSGIRYYVAARNANVEHATKRLKDLHKNYYCYRIKDPENHIAYNGPRK